MNPQSQTNETESAAAPTEGQTANDANNTTSESDGLVEAIEGNSFTQSVENAAEAVTPWLEARFPNQPWETEYVGNSLAQYATAAVIALAVIGGIYFVKAIALFILKQVSGRTQTTADDIIESTIRRIPLWFVITLGVLTGLAALTLPSWLNGFIAILAVIVIAFEVIRLVNFVIKKAVERRIEKLPEEEGNRASALQLLAVIAAGLVWVIGFLMVIANFGVNVTSLVAGLGIGGLALALALQTVLSDLLSSFSLYFDRPFKVGDFIIVGDRMGTVKKIGFKTTRIQALGGEELVIPNSELTSATVHNYRKMEERRVVFEIGVEYDTDLEVMRQIPDWIEEIIEPLDILRFDRAHFKNFGDSALIFETVYFVETNDYNIFMDLQQKINLDLLEKLRVNNVGIAFPTRTIHMVTDSN